MFNFNSPNAGRFERVQIGDATLYRGDCLEILPTLGKVDAVVTDPPYGQSLKVNVTAAPARFYAGVGTIRRIKKNYPDIHGDDKPFDPTPWIEFAPSVVLWGAHKFAHNLPAGSWLVWDKVPTGKVRDQGDGEAAWINADRPLRIFRLLWDGICVDSAARKEVTAGTPRVHPSQKPEALMRWSIQQVGNPRHVLDPYMGAGSTGVAAIQMGLQFTGVEIDRRYFDIACKRIEAAYAQGRFIFDEQTAAPPEQKALIA